MSNREIGVAEALQGRRGGKEQDTEYLYMTFMYVCVFI